MFSPYRVVRLAAFALELAPYLDTYKVTLTTEQAGNKWPLRP